MRLIVACSFLTLAACKGTALAPRDAGPSPMPPAPVPSPGAALCPPAVTGAALQLPALAASRTVRLDFNRRGGSTPQQLGARMIVDDTLTDVPWPVRRPLVHGLADGRSLIYDGDAYGVMLWEPAARALTRLTEGTLVPVPGLGFLIRTEDDDQVSTFWDLDPARPALRPLWRGGGSGVAVEVAGVLDGAPALLVRDVGRQPLFSLSGDAPPSPPAPRLVCLRGPGAATELPIALPDDRQVASADAIRGHRVLLHGRELPVQPSMSVQPEPPFTVPVEILDLDRNTRRTIGSADGAWTIATAIPHAYVRVRWTDHDPAIRDRPMVEAGVLTEIDPATEQLR